MNRERFYLNKNRKIVEITLNLHYNEIAIYLSESK